MSKNITVRCNRCGQTVYKDNTPTSCTHIDAEESQDFYKYLKSKAKKPIYYGKLKRG
jgi:ribosomal protein L37E